MNKQIKNVAVGAVMAGAMLVGVAQGAEVQGDVAAQAVRYEDLNLKTDAGVQVLYKRIQGAAKEVCGDVDGRDLQVARAHQACVAHAVADAVATVNNQMLTKTVTVAQVR